MVRPTSISDRKPFAAAFPIALLAFTFTTGSSHAGFRLHCEAVEGTLREREVTPAPASTTTGRMAGDIEGKYSFALDRIEPTDPSTSTVVLFVGKSVVNTEEGDLSFTESGAIDTVGRGNLSDLMTITGGTGEWEGASGQIHLFGFYSLAKGRGRAEYEGTV